ncbi:SDR family NAD(P)-dependent oxidoreductase [Bacillus horti]|uniref:3-oxoacyl-[acyl-carrier protein] reductase n=1 Tax=Caldalkalibacillus horti TaxID=77523 RepID=A0ABT9VVH3_9BACI|nr:3-oxoacyl-ACP reductase family protein [Bacillus horti]MDQ0164981.1 3-oxoacyl-[acyl-carrier protein] reductase [Bacillus horti]
MYSFENQVAFVTGSSTGIGRAAALAFAEHGADVVVHYNTSEKEAKEVYQEIINKGRKSLLVQGDVTKQEDIERIAKEIEDFFGHVDILMNNAGSMVKRARLEEMEEDVWDQVMAVNLKSVVFVTQAILPLMKKKGKGRVINLASIAGHNGGGKGALAYATSKGAVATLTRGLAKDLLEYNIQVNAISPGVISTPFHDRFSTPEFRKQLVTQIPFGREGTPEEAIGPVLFLASSYANYITGEIVEVNGGQLMR